MLVLQNDATIGRQDYVSSAFFSSAFNPASPFGDQLKRVLYSFPAPALTAKLPVLDIEQAEDLYGLPPYQRVHPGVKSYLRKMEYFHTLQEFISTWEFESNNALFEGENPLDHASLRGHLIAGAGTEIYGLEPGTTVSLPTTLEVSSAANLLTTTKYDVEIPSDFLGVTATDFCDSLDGQLGFMGVLSYPQNTMYASHIMDVTYDQDDYGFYANYAQYIKMTSLQRHHILLWQARVVPSYAPSIDYDTAYDMNTVFDLVYYRWGWNVVVKDGYGPDVDFWTGSSWQTYFNNLSLPYTGRTMGGQSYYNTYISNVSYSANRVADIKSVMCGSSIESFSHFVDTTDHLVDEAAPLAALAVKDAYDSSFEESKLNFFESFPDFAELGGLLPTVQLLKALPRISKLRGGSLAIKILKVAASADLLYSFGLAPNIDDIDFVVDKGLAALGTFDRLFTDQKLYGTYTYDITDDFSVLVGVKVVTNIHPDSVLSAVLPMKTLGLFPDLSTIWAVIPFSFVFDWLINNGRSLEVVDAGFAMMAMDVQYSTVSLTFRQRLPDDFLLDHGSINGPGATEFGSHYRRHIRFPLSGFPMVAPSNMLTQALLQGNVPSWDIPISLAITLL